MPLPLLSFVIPAYNHEKYIEQAVRAVMEQTYPNMELLIIDDGSTDSTWQKLCELRESCERRFVRTVFIRQENQGASQTLATLISMTQGEFISSCASDDKYKSPTALERMVSFLIEHPDYALVVGDNEIIDSEGRTCYWAKDRSLCYDKDKAAYHTFVDFLKTYGSFDEEKFGTYSSLYLCNYIPNGFTFRKSIYDIIEKPTEQSPLEDWFLMMQLAKYAKLKYIDEVFYSYRWHGSNTIKKSSYLHDIEIKTRNYEEKILHKTVSSPLMPLRPDVADVAKNGVLYKKRGLPGVVEIHTYRKGTRKIKKLLVFSKVLAVWSKQG